MLLRMQQGGRHAPQPERLGVNVRRRVDLPMAVDRQQELRLPVALLHPSQQGRVVAFLPGGVARAPLVADHSKAVQRALVAAHPITKPTEVVHIQGDRASGVHPQGRTQGGYPGSQLINPRTSSLGELQATGTDLLNRNRCNVACRGDSRPYLCATPSSSDWRWAALAAPPPVPTARRRGGDGVRADLLRFLHRRARGVPR